MLGLAWELMLAPLRPGGSWLVLKVVPLLLPLPAMLRGSAYAMQVALFIVLLSVLEGSVRLFDPAPGRVACGAEVSAGDRVLRRRDRLPATDEDRRQASRPVGMSTLDDAARDRRRQTTC